MKFTFFITAALIFTIGSVANARNNDITCLDKTIEIANQKLSQALTQNVVAMLAKKGIQLKEDANTLEVSGAQVIFETDGIYGYFSLTGSIITTSDGTELIVEYKKTSWNSYENAVNAYYKPVLTARGFDKQGNARDGHCTLISDDVRVDNRAEFILVSNTKTGRVIGRASLPSKISVY